MNEPGHPEQLTLTEIPEAVCIDPRREAQIKKKQGIDQLCPSDVIAIADDFYPKVPDSYPERPEPRQYQCSVYADAKIRGVVRHIHRDHPHIQRAGIHYLIYKAGIMQIHVVYGEQIQGLKEIQDDIDRDPYKDGMTDGIPLFSINQTGGYIQEMRSNFTLSDRDLIREMAEDSGIALSSLMVVASCPLRR